MERRLTISVEGKEFLSFEEIIKQAHGYWSNTGIQLSSDPKRKAQCEERAELCRRILHGEN